MPRPCECGTSVQSTLGGSSGRARKVCALCLGKQRAEHTARQDYLIASALGACTASSATSACTWCAVLAWAAQHSCALLSARAEATAPVELTVNGLRRALAARTTLHSLWLSTPVRYSAPDNCSGVQQQARLVSRARCGADGAAWRSRGNTPVLQDLLIGQIRALGAAQRPAPRTSARGTT